MSITDPVLLAPVTRSLPPLQVFQNAAERGPELSADALQGGLAVFGPPPAGKPGVTWIRPSNDATGMFIEALRQSFGPGMGDAIARELALQPAPGQPLMADDVHRAIALGEASRPALAGVDFGTRMQHRATVNAPGFLRAAAAIGLAPDQVDATTRQEIDARMCVRFDQANAAGHSPVSGSTAEKWLQDELLPLTR